MALLLEGALTMLLEKTQLEDKNRIHLEECYQRVFAEPMGFQGNGMLSGMLSANALLDIPANSDRLLIGAEVDVRLLVN
ncbi:molybdopterin biosynthesis enzyme [Sporomusaceae bacterium BoRhaA]|uniref:hypothetical protein n=1 Tax=Pelorhabdus rhamnosifermentans TaxID=2772457 RepID=UPI001C0630C6|nr:hypothetical protein [Pelorhabdus rhamnosifermentans]MBU2703103.1 molybdopterin biosynthesis enzyme [Pelorhabdus rhamnosifermentans]